MLYSIKYMCICILLSKNKIMNLNFIIKLFLIIVNINDKIFYLLTKIKLKVN